MLSLCACVGLSITAYGIPRLAGVLVVNIWFWLKRFPLRASLHEPKR